MSKTIIATVMNFLVPGAGLLYLGRALIGLINFIIAAALTFLAAVYLSEYTHYALLIVAAGSAGFAHSVATDLENLESKNQ